LGLEGSNRSLNEKLSKHVLEKAEEYRGNSPKNYKNSIRDLNKATLEKKKSKIYTATPPLSA